MGMGFNMKNLIGIEIPVDNLEKGIKFYETVFDWTFDREKFPGHGVVQLNGCVEIGIFQAEKVRPKGLNVGIGVEDIDGTLKKVVQEGGKIVKDKFKFEYEGHVAVFQDYCGSEFSLWSN
ncbi:MAG: VOC family protein [Candidatus Hodarchaeales archaeon]|jgi:predicted enzyme related to lactoylglutathione lyase